MISYNWDHQALIVKLKQELVKQGIHVWLDLEQMNGSTLMAMAEAVEHSKVFLVCMTEKYQNSDNCRLEGEYAMQQKKLVIPLMAQSGFRPKGWLGMMLGTKLYYDFCNPEAFDNMVAETVKAIRKAIPADPTAPATPIPPIAVASPLKPASPKPDAWNHDQVQAWLKGLELSAQFPQAVDGAVLSELHTLLNKDAPFYYSFVQREFLASAIDCCASQIRCVWFFDKNRFCNCREKEQTQNA